jgi:signal recognition particle subunit SEC65
VGPRSTFVNTMELQAELTVEQRRRVVRRVASSDLSVEDVRVVLEALGLSAVEGRITPATLEPTGEESDRG